MNNDTAQIQEMVQLFMYLMPIMMIAGFLLMTAIVTMMIKWLKFADSTFTQAIAIILAGSLVSIALSAPLFRIGTELPVLMLFALFIGGMILPFFGFTAGTWLISRESIGRCFGLTALIGVSFVVLFILLIILIMIIGMIFGAAGV